VEKVSRVRCAEARRTLSVLLDDEAVSTRHAEAVRAHVHTCGDCSRYQEQLHAVRARLRIEPVDRPVDLAPQVVARLPATVARRPARAVSLVAAFVAAFVAGASFVGVVSGPEPVGARDLSGAVLRAQRAIDSLRADVTVVERGWHPDVPVRRLEGTLAYRAPESLALHLRDLTEYPSDEWVRADVDLVVAADRSWERAVVRCPRDAMPGCTPRAPRTRALVGREPFPDLAPAPLDLVVPVQSFARSGGVDDLGARTIDGRRAVGVRVTVAQIAPLLRGVRELGNGRPLHATDVAEVWVDRDAMVPLAVDVRPAPTAERAEWAASRGLDDRDEVVYALRLRDVRVDVPVADASFPAPPADAITRDAGFEPRPVAAPDPAWLPPAMRPVRSGVVRVASGPEVAVRAWSDGRAWVKVATTSQWAGGRLFGDLGAVVRALDVGSGTGYADERGERVALHGDDVDVLVTGTVPTDELVRVAASLGVRGVPVPAGWNEAATVDVAQLAAEGALLPAGAGEPAARRAGDTVTLAYAGPGARGFLVTQTPGRRLGPPFDPDARAVEVRGRVARWSPALGLLEWTERDLVVSLTSRTLGLGELVAVAEGMR
jgi:hypothetical protein